MIIDEFYCTNEETEPQCRYGNPIYYETIVIVDNNLQLQVIITV